MREAKDRGSKWLLEHHGDSVSFFGGKAMGFFEESPLVMAVVDKARVKNTRNNLMTVLEARFGPLNSEMIARLEGVSDETRLTELIADAARCSGLDEFRSRLISPPEP